jgi:hypothetical protein
LAGKLGRIFQKNIVTGDFRLDLVPVSMSWNFSGTMNIKQVDPEQRPGPDWMIA